MTTDRVTPLLRGALVPTLVVAAGALIVATIIDGPRGLWGAALGAVVVITFSGLGLLAFRLVRKEDPYVLLLTAIGSYTIRVIVFAVATGVAARIDGLDSVLNRTAMGLTVVACVAAWLTGELRAFVKARQPIYDLDEKPASEASGGVK
jgi:ATP synthase protein I